MILSDDDRHEIRGYLRALDLSVQEAAELTGVHRTTFSKKLAGAQKITPSDLLGTGRAIGRREVSQPIRSKAA